MNVAYKWPSSFWEKQILMLTTDCNSFWKIQGFCLFPIQMSMRTILTLTLSRSRSSKSHHWTNYDWLESPMVHTKFHDIGLLVREKKFLEGLPYVGMAAILVMWPGPREQTFVPPSFEPPHEIWLQLAQWFQRRSSLRSWNIFYGHSLPSADSRRAVVSFWRKNVHNTG